MPQKTCVDHKHFLWDHYSDQPSVIKDKAFKRRLYCTAAPDFAKAMLTSLFIYPAAFLRMWRNMPQKVKPAKKNTRAFFGISVNLDKNPHETRALIEELDIGNLLVRVPLSDIGNIDAYRKFCDEFSDRKLLINVLQDRAHIEDHDLLRESLTTVFTQLRPVTRHFQIGNAVNRKKWGFCHITEYLKFYSVAQSIKQEQFPDLMLAGPSVIDFEYQFTIRALFNRFPVQFDQLSALLYIDRRGQPENTQSGFNLCGKIDLLEAICALSGKSGKRIVITETNWPIENTYPFAPTSNKECVSLEEHANYLVRYYLLALSTRKVRHVYWHQLIAPGYGLVDNRDGLKKYPAFHALRTMIATLRDHRFVKLVRDGDCYRMKFKGENRIDVYWGRSGKIDTRGKTIVLRDGEVIEAPDMEAGDSPFYAISRGSKCLTH